MTLGSARAGCSMILFALLCSCSGGSTAPTSGILSVRLNAMHGDEGAVLFTIAGGSIQSVEAVSGIARSAQIDANTLRVVITGALSSGTIARVHIADLSLAAHYSVAIDQVASRLTYGLRDAAQYSASIAP